jgi:hypothetical protein
VTGVVRDDDVDSERGRNGLDRRDGVAPVRRPARAPPPRALDESGREQARAARLVGDGGIQLRERVGVGSLEHARDRRLAERTARTEDEAELEERDVLVPAGHVAAQGVDEARDDRRA